jgi:hypothetical protein
MGYQMFQVIVKTPMSPPPASNLIAPKLKWACAVTTAKQSCYAIYYDAGNNLNICSLLKFKFYLTDDLRINEINAV